MTDPLPRLRRFLRLMLLIGMLGVGTELVLMEHDEELNQLIPLIALGVGLLALAWDTLAAGRAARVVFVLAMWGLVASGLAGLYFHYESNVEFQRELDPALAGWRLVLATMRAHSPPSLGPAILCFLGALGWVVPRASEPSTPA